MKSKLDKRIPRFSQLIVPTFIALKELGGSGKNDEILDKIISNLNIPDEVVDIQHKGGILINQAGNFHGILHNHSNQSSQSHSTDTARRGRDAFGRGCPPRCRPRRSPI